MQGRLVRLTRPAGEDYQLIAQWLVPSGAVAPLTGDLDAEPSAEQIQQRDSASHRFYVIRSMADDTPLGTVNCRREGPGWYSLGGAIGQRELWHSGYAADAFIVLINHLFHSCNARKVSGTVFAFNKSALRMMTRSGFVCEGILREHCYLDGQWHDAVLWSMLRDEFYSWRGAAAQVSDRLVGQDLVPPQDKAEARKILAEYLRSAGTSISEFVKLT